MCYLNSKIFATFMAFAAVAATGQNPIPTSEPSTKRVDALNLAHSIPPYYAGVDLKTLIDQLAASDSSRAKSRFESTSEYESRLAKTPTLPESLQNVADHSIGLVVTPKLGGFSFTGVDLSYDADAELFTFHLHFSSERSILTPGSPVLARIQLSDELTHADHGEGTTGLGIKVQTSDLSTRVYGIAVDAESWLVGTSSAINTRDISVHVSRKGAEFVETQLRFALIGTLEKPWLAHRVTISDATVELPTRLTAVEDDLVFKPVEVLIFRNDTGEVLRTDDALGPTFPTTPTENSIKEIVNTTGGTAAPPAVTPPLHHLPTNFLSGSSPVYPPIARATHVSGPVVVRFTVDKQGKPYNIVAVSGHPFLVQAALEAIKTWQFKPFLQDGVPVEMNESFAYNFTLGN